jgi:hypothetical protein
VARDNMLGLLISVVGVTVIMAEVIIGDFASLALIAGGYCWYRFNKLEGKGE